MGKTVSQSIRLCQAAQRIAVAADRFAREIVGFLTVCAARSRQLNGNPLGLA
jgi:hypothetical protein